MRARADVDERAQRAVVVYRGGGVDDAALAQTAAGLDDGLGEHGAAAAQFGKRGDNGTGMDNIGQGETQRFQTAAQPPPRGIIADGDGGLVGVGGDAAAEQIRAAQNGQADNAAACGAVVEKHNPRPLRGGQRGGGQHFAVAARADDDEVFGGHKTVSVGLL